MHVALENRKDTLEDAQAVLEEYKRTGDLKLRNQLVLHYAPYIKAAIFSMRSLLLSNLSVDDFFNQGVLAVIECIDRYDPARGAQLDTYLYKVIRGRLINYARRQNWLPNRVWSARKRIKAAQAELEAKLMRTPTEQELADALDMTAGQLEKLQLEIAAADTVSYEDLLEQSCENAAHRQLESDEPDVDSNLLETEMRQQLAKAIAQLPPRHKQVITLCYYEHLNLREIGEVLNLTQQRVSQIRANALSRLAKAMKEYENG